MKIKKYFFIGVGGAGMSAVANLLLQLGYKVYGSDLNENDNVNRLRKLGAEIFLGHEEKNIKLLDDVTNIVISETAIPADNPELMFAKKNNLIIETRVDVLTRLMSNYYQVLIAGSHGKTSTTSLVIESLNFAKKNPNYVVGGVLKSSNTNSRIQESELFVAEVDESDGSILQYAPNLIGITNIEADHLNFYRTENNYFQVFIDFIFQLPKKGKLVLNYSDPGIKSIIPKIKNFIFDKQIEVTLIVDNKELNLLKRTKVNFAKKIIVYKFFPNKINSIEFAGIEKDTLQENGEKTLLWDELDLKIYGYHMLVNAVFTLAVLDLLKIENPKILIENFKGVKRRSDFVGEVNNIKIFNDYAHHPTEIKSLLESMRNLVQNDKKMIVWFQPHLYSRTKDFAKDFAKELSLADNIFISKIFPAREMPIPGVTGKIITDQMNPKKAEYIEDINKVIERIVDISEKGDLILLVGAGDLIKYENDLMVKITENIS